MTRRRRDLGRRGVAALEFALCSPVLLIMLGGTVDFGMASYSRSEIANAVAAGAQYAYLTGSSVTNANIKSVVQSASNLTGVSVTVTGPAGYCVMGAGPSMTTATAGSTCSDGSIAGTYVIINVSYTYAGLLSAYSYPSTFNLSDSATMQLQ